MGVAMSFDAHVHVCTDDLERYPLAAGFTPEQLLVHARACGVSRIFLIQMTF